MVTTLAGGAAPGFADGEGSAAAFDEAVGLAIADGGLVVTDGKPFSTEGTRHNQLVRFVTFAGAVSTIAGDGDAGWSDGAPGEAEFDGPAGVWLAPDGGIYVADLFNYRIRLIAQGTVSTVAGGGAVAAPSDQDRVGLPPAVQAATPDDQPNGLFAGPWSLVGDSQGNLFVGDRSAVVRLPLPPGVGGPSPIVGVVNAPGNTDGADGRFSFVTALALGADGSLYAGDMGCVRKIPSNGNGLSGTLVTLAGSCDFAFPGDQAKDGPGPTARFGPVTGLAVDAKGDIYVADEHNVTIREILPP